MLAIPGRRRTADSMLAARVCVVMRCPCAGFGCGSSATSHECAFLLNWVPPVKRLGHFTVRDRSGAAAVAWVAGTLCVLKFLLDQIQPSNGTGTWSADLVSHLETGFGSSGYSVQDMGFPTSWRTEALWK
uniref:Uncharacterized protein n=1 Tax=Rhodococcus hoagii TaxID=43767 RepID=A0A1Z1V0B3_RHOHA|nr:hypothetical protein pVAPB1413_0722 [Prescottella equi]ARX60665.1 hypothetical protein pVAPB1533_0722 [Prescottella equi]